MAPPLLELEDVEARYGPIKALDGVSLAVGEGEVVALLGANGAGKTTTLRAVSGTVRRTGRISFAGRALGRRSPEAVARAGIAHVPEGRGTFGELTVRENLRLGAWTRRGRLRGEEERVLAHFPALAERTRQHAGTLSGGEQQMLALGRAMMSEPHLICLDEPSLGLAPMIVQDIFRTIKSINDAGTSVLLVEQNALMALAVANRGYVLQTGSIVLADDAASLMSNDMVRKAYLGEE